MSYLELVLLFLGISAVPLLLAVVLARPSARWFASLALAWLALFVLTAVFDNVMIAADLFRYEESNLTGVHVGLAPIEDFAWPLAAVMVVPPLALLFARRSKEKK